MSQQNILLGLDTEWTWNLHEQEKAHGIPALWQLGHPSGSQLRPQAQSCVSKTLSEKCLCKAMRIFLKGI